MSVRVTEVVARPAPTGAEREALLHLLFAGEVPADVAERAAKQREWREAHRPSRPSPLDVACPYCKRGPREWCRTASGGSATGLHGARHRLAARS